MLPKLFNLKLYKFYLNQGILLPAELLKILSLLILLCAEKIEIHRVKWMDSKP